jgi:CTP:molybdopterin cytidylyltransferase MocA
MMESNQSIPNITLLILAAGAGRRFGGIKQLTPIDGKPLLRSDVENTHAPDRYHQVVVLGAYAQEITPSIADLDIDIVENPDWQTGLSSSIRCGIEFIEQHLPHIEALIIVLGDQWKLTSVHLQTLLDIHAGAPENIVASAYDGRGGVPACFPRQYWPMLKALSGDQGAGKILGDMEGVLLVDIPEARVDVDVPEDLS